MDRTRPTGPGRRLHSMSRDQWEANINNRVGDAQSRLEAFQNALQDGTERSREFLNSVERMDTPVRVFSYAFGLRMGDVCDLFSMMKAADGVISPEEIEDMKATIHGRSHSPLLI